MPETTAPRAEASSSDRGPSVTVPVDALLRSTVLDAAQPLASALAALYGSPLWAKASDGTSITYSDGGVKVVAPKHLPDDQRETVYGHFIDAFQAAGWGFSTRLNSTLTYRVSVSFNHPTLLTR
ncbi:hypothetical protein ACIP9H_33900 [Streptomyces sp. NPDC088732]|uniref:hypothetical protein n=1 Tax=Streptomyces sp. NPDC088732 TaxID=3365879 RepID=UPI0038099275